MKVSKSKNIIMIKNDFYDCCNTFDIVEERLFYFICNEYRKMYNTLSLNGGFNDDVIEYQKDYTITKFKIDYSVIRKELNHHKKSKNHIIHVVKKLPMSIIYLNNGDIIKYALFEYIHYKDDEDCFYFKILPKFLEVLKVKDFDKTFFKIHYNEYKKIRGNNSQKLYRLASRFLNLKFYKMNISTLKNYFGIDENTKISHIDQMLKRSIKHLSEETKFKINFTKTKEGRNIKYYTFNFAR